MKIVNGFIVLCLAFMSFLAFGQDIPAPTTDDFTALFAALGGLKGLGALGIAAVAVQAVMLFWRTKFSEFAGKQRFLIFMFLSLVSSVVALLVAGQSWGAILTNTVILTALQNFAHQIYTQFFSPKA